ncbi:hypothetical protein MQH10_15210 [Phenylobacterium aquaticum]|nr:hypothetical protein [Phenylobacterium aquaticum]MCI3133620.1 hypothetical protein [Phenylobacterium aquaticum]
MTPPDPGARRSTRSLGEFPARRQGRRALSLDLGDHGLGDIATTGGDRAAHGIGAAIGVGLSLDALLEVPIGRDAREVGGGVGDPRPVLPILGLGVGGRGAGRDDKGEGGDKEALHDEGSLRGRRGLRWPFV